MKKNRKKNNKKDLKNCFHSVTDRVAIELPPLLDPHRIGGAIGGYIANMAICSYFLSSRCGLALFATFEYYQSCRHFYA